MNSPHYLILLLCVASGLCGLVKKGHHQKSQKYVGCGKKIFIFLNHPTLFELPRFFSEFSKAYGGKIHEKYYWTGHGWCAYNETSTLSIKTYS